MARTNAALRMMHTFAVIDAFTNTAYGGNPAAVVRDADVLSSAAMQEIATRLGLPETVFLLTSEVATVHARYFTPREELAMAGHPSIALAHDFQERGLMPHSARITLETQAGIIPVTYATKAGEPQYTMRQRAPEFGERLDAKTIADALGLALDDVMLPPQIVSTGNPMLLVALTSISALENAIPDRDALFANATHRFVGVHCFARTDDTPYAFECRNFGAPGDLPEDPATGSAVGPMGAYVFANRLISHPTFLVSQGRALGRPAVLHVSVIGSADQIEAIDVGGGAVTTLQGMLVTPTSPRHGVVSA